MCGFAAPNNSNNAMTTIYVKERRKFAIICLRSYTYSIILDILSFFQGNVKRFAFTFFGFFVSAVKKKRNRIFRVRQK